MSAIKITGGNVHSEIRLVKRDFEGESEARWSQRKRERLDHLSEEEKLVRRKLLNREAAQIARDKKKLRLDYLEGAHARQSTLLSRLSVENKALRSENDDLRERLRRAERDLATRLVVPKIKMEPYESAALSSLPQKVVLLILLVLIISPKLNSQTESLSSRIRTIIPPMLHSHLKPLSVVRHQLGAVT